MVRIAISSSLCEYRHEDHPYSQHHDEWLDGNTSDLECVNCPRKRMCPPQHLQASRVTVVIKMVIVTT